jgi:hypothetical protein
MRDNDTNRRKAMYDKRYFVVGDVVRFDYNGYKREGQVVKLTDTVVTITYLKMNPSDGAEVQQIKSFSFHKIYGLETLEMAP